MASLDYEQDYGPRNKMLGFFSEGIYTWIAPSAIDESVKVRVYVWGAGGANGHNATSAVGLSNGGGGGGLAISEFDIAAGFSCTVTVGAPARTYNTQGGGSSFAPTSGVGFTTVSASGGRSGYNATDPTGNSTGESNNPQSGNYGQGGVGVDGNIVNRRGGMGGMGGATSSYYQGSGASAPGPDGTKDGRFGGDAFTTWASSAGGASINYRGTSPPAKNYTTTSGSGTAGAGGALNDYNITDGDNWGWPSGGAGLLGAGGCGGNGCGWQNATLSGTNADDGHGHAIWAPNQIFLGGGGGGAGGSHISSSAWFGCNAGNGGPGAGGGGATQYGGAYYANAGNGGVLGGGGSADYYSVPGNGGSAGGGGAESAGSFPANGGNGGAGIVFIQWAEK